MCLCHFDVIIACCHQKMARREKETFFFCNPGNIMHEENYILRLYLFQMSCSFIVRKKKSKSCENRSQLFFLLTNDI